MSVEGSSEYQQVNARDAERGRILDLDLNYPPPSENMALAGALGVQAQDVAEFIDDEVAIISPRKFAEARNNSGRNHYRRSRRVIDGLSDELTSWRAFSQLGAFNWEFSLNVGVCNKTKDTATNVPVPPIEPESEPEIPTFTCAICMGQLIEETSTKCGHIFCKKCIETAIATQHKCPTCRHKLRKRDTIRVFLPPTS